MYMSYLRRRRHTYRRNASRLYRILFTCVMYKSRVRHTHDPVSSIDRGRNYTYEEFLLVQHSLDALDIQLIRSILD